MKFTESRLEQAIFNITQEVKTSRYLFHEKEQHVLIQLESKEDWLSFIISAKDILHSGILN